jgi:starch phosphorylase
MGAHLVNWHRALEQNWSILRFGEAKVTSEGGKHLFLIQVYLAGLDPNAIQIELYAEGENGGKPIRHEMMRGQQLVGAEGYLYSAQVPSTRPVTDYTARVIPYYSGVAVPLEAPQILWQW